MRILNRVFWLLPVVLLFGCRQGDKPQTASPLPSDRYVVISLMLEDDFESHRVVELKAGSIRAKGKILIPASVGREFTTCLTYCYAGSYDVTSSFSLRNNGIETGELLVIDFAAYDAQTNSNIFSAMFFVPYNGDSTVILDDPSYKIAISEGALSERSEG